MKTSQPFEIRVALVGHVSVGKTTLINALLKDKYSEVSMRRTTAGVNMFRISADNSSENEEEESAKAAAWTAEDICTPEETLQETTQDNRVLRDCDVVHEKVFDIQLDKNSLNMEMRDDTRLVLIDIPGINEAGATSMYKEYVSDNWNSFDCVVVVLDGRQGVNTEEQINMLQLAKQHCDDIKNIPLIVLLNKVDDPEDEEAQLLVKESRETVEKMFQVSDRAKALNEIISTSAISNNENESFPILVSMSAIHAYIYRTASKLDAAAFERKIDKSLVERIGKEAYGRAWKSIEDEAEKIQKAYQAVRDPSQRKDALEESRLHHFLKALSYCVGGADTQTRLLGENIQNEASLLSSSDRCYVTKLRSLYDRSKALGLSADFITNRFYDLLTATADEAFRGFSTDGPASVHLLANSMNDLTAFLDLARHMGIAQTEASEILMRAQALVFRQAEVVLMKQQCCWETSNLSPYDYMLILGSMRPSYERVFFEHFGLLHIVIEKEFQAACATAASIKDQVCRQCHSKLVSMTQLNCLCQSNHDASSQGASWGSESPFAFQVKNGVACHDLEQWKKHVALSVDYATMQPSNPSHFGHLIWQYCRLVESVEADFGQAVSPALQMEFETTLVKRSELPVANDNQDLKALGHGSKKYQTHPTQNKNKADAPKTGVDCAVGTQEAKAVDCPSNCTSNKSTQTHGTKPETSEKTAKGLKRTSAASPSMMSPTSPLFSPPTAFACSPPLKTDQALFSLGNTSRRSRRKPSPSKKHFSTQTRAPSSNPSSPSSNPSSPSPLFFGSSKSPSTPAPAFASRTHPVFGYPQTNPKNFQQTFSLGFSQTNHLSFGSTASPPHLGSHSNPGASASAPVFGAGSGSTPFQATAEQDNGSKIVLQSITAMPQYQRESFEEIRFKYHSRKNGKNPGLFC